MAALQIVEAWNGPGRRDGEITTVAPSDNGAHPSTDKHAFEHWYFDAHLDDGRIVVAMLQTRELVHRKPGVEIHVYSPDASAGRWCDSSPMRISRSPPTGAMSGWARTSRG